MPPRRVKEDVNDEGSGFCGSSFEAEGPFSLDEGGVGGKRRHGSAT